MKRKEVIKANKSSSLILPDEEIKQICAGGNHSMILTESGAMYTFGYGAHGQLG